ncbi:MAG: hypothetical protein ACI31A_04935 [Candidatus Limisoma sp.]
MKKFSLLSLILCATAATASAANLVVLGQFVSGSQDDLTYIEGVSGKAAFDATTQTLTLEDATISTTESEAAIWTNFDDFKIIVKGNNTLKSADISLYFIGNKMTISGGGVLNLECDSYAALYISSGDDQTTTIKDCTVLAKSSEYGILGFDNGLGSEISKLVVDNAKVIAYGATNAENTKTYPAVKALKELTLNNCAITYPANAHFGVCESEDSWCVITDTGAAVVDKVEITPNGEGAVSSIESDSAQPTAIYDISGRRINDYCNGVNIIKYTDGKVQKVVKRVK